MDGKLTAAELRGAGYDEEDIELMMDMELLSRLKEAEKEYARGDFIEWRPGMFIESEQQNLAESKSAERRPMSGHKSMRPFPLSQPIHTTA